MRGVRGHDRYALRLAAWLVLLAFCIPGGAVLATPPGERLAPDQSLGKSLEGDPVVVGDLAGQPAILTFWRTDCPPCMKELPLLEALRRTQGHRLHIAVSIDRPLPSSSIQMAWSATSRPASVKGPSRRCSTSWATSSSRSRRPLPDAKVNPFTALWPNDWDAFWIEEVKEQDNERSPINTMERIA